MLFLCLDQVDSQSNIEFIFSVRKVEKNQHQTLVKAAPLSYQHYYT